MTIAPIYSFATGTEFKVHGRELLLHNVGEHGYEVIDPDGGGIHVLGFSEFIELTKSGGLTFDTPTLSPQGSAKLRLGGLSVAEQLSAEQQEHGKFNYAECAAIDQLYKQRVMLEGRKGFRISISSLDNTENRKFLRPIVEAIFGKRVYLDTKKLRGGKQHIWGLHSGRTLMKYYNVYRALPEGDDVIAGLAPLDHLRGNKKPRICWRLRELMTEAWEEIGLDLKGTSAANVHAHLVALVNRENKLRAANNLKELITPSQRTLARHRKELLSPSEYLVATKGERFARNKRGRGSSDVRAVLIGLALKKWRAPTEEPGGVLWEMATDR
ncbi:hypothetical protein PXK17_21005, partial [Phaeobacter gallaeciensis]